MNNAHAIGNKIARLNQGILYEKSQPYFNTKKEGNQLDFASCPLRRRYSLVFRDSLSFDDVLEQLFRVRYSATHPQS